MDLQALKARVDLRDLVQETHQLTKGSKTHCLWHDDTNPSLHVYPDGYYCFVCGASGDHLDWLVTTRALSFQEAVEVLTRSTGTPSSHTLALKALPSLCEAFEKRDFERHLPLEQPQLETHKRRAAKLAEVPEALMSRGFTLADCQNLGIVNENGNAIFPVTAPDGSVLALKCRYAVPNPHRYEYVTPGRGTPAWCSPGIRAAETVLVVEGELNGMACWLALRGQESQIGVMGTAGVHGPLHLEVLEDKTVYVYADGDEAGDGARQRWAKQALSAGATEAFLLEPWPMDVCEVAGAFGKAALRKRLAWSRKQPFVPTKSFGAVRALGATTPAPKLFPSLSAKPDLVQGCSHSKVLQLSSVLQLLSSSPTLAPECRRDAA